MKEKKTFDKKNVKKIFWKKMYNKDNQCDTIFASLALVDRKRE